MTVLVMKDGEPVYSKSFGLMNLNLSRPNGPETVYPIGSLTKQFTAFSVQLLAHQGKLSLDADIHRYLPELPPYPWPMTVRMLLTHTSGVRDNVSLLLAKGKRVDDVTTEAETVGILLRQRGLNYEPGSRYLYSNGNYVLLAKIVERTSGQSYPDFLQKHIFTPLSMMHSSVVGEPVGLTIGKAEGYAGTTHVPQSQVDSTYGSTGILSTAGDLAVWAAQFQTP